MTLVRTDTIADSDFLGSQTYRMTDGSTVPSQRFVIQSLKVGDKALENVVGSIAPVAGEPASRTKFPQSLQVVVDRQSKARADP